MKRFLWWGLIALAVFFALQGGEYSTKDLYVLRGRTGELSREVDSLQRQVDSLGRFLHLLKTDSATQERIAREEFGMVRGDREILYRFGETSESPGDRRR